MNVGTSLVVEGIVGFGANSEINFTNPLDKKFTSDVILSNYECGGSSVYRLNTTSVSDVTKLARIKNADVFTRGFREPL